MTNDLCYPEPPDVMGDPIPSDQFPWPLMPWDWPPIGEEEWNLCHDVMG